MCCVIVLQYLAIMRLGAELSIMRQVLQRVLNARQFGLKLIANVTYGYAAAGFSGRMPMAEFADAIVQVQICQLDHHAWDNSSEMWQSVHKLPSARIDSCDRVIKEAWQSSW